MAGPYVSLILMSGGVALAAGGHYGLVGLRDPRHRIDLLFALAGFIYTWLAFCGSQYATAQTVEAYAAWHRASLVPSRFFFALFFWWVYEFSERKIPWSVVVGVYTVEVIKTVILCSNLRTPWMIDMQGVEFVTLPWGEVITHHSGEGVPGQIIMPISSLVSVTYMTIAAAVLFRNGHRDRGAAMVTIVAAIGFGGIYDNSIDYLGLPTVYLTELLAIVPVLVMGWFVASRVLESARLKEAVVQNERELRTVLDSVGDMIVALDLEGRLLRANAPALRLLGLDPQRSASGRPFGELVELVALGTGRPLSFYDETALANFQRGPVDARARTSDPEAAERRVSVLATPIRTPDERMIGVVVSMRDETARVELETQLRQAQKMEAVGRLAGGVAHDFNNILTSITGCAAFLADALDEDVELREDAELIVHGCERAADLTAKLLAFSRRVPAARAACSVHRLLGNVATILSRSIDPRIRIDLDLAAEQDEVEANASELESALLNLGINAVDAMKDGGVLTYATERRGDTLVIAVRDTGSGIAPDVIDRIFEPFFTTKDVGRGTGLGLAAVYGTVQELGGRIAVSSEPGEGSTFELLLPILSGRAQNAQHGDVRLPNSPALGPLTILMLDDDVAVQHATRRMLSIEGLEVICATNIDEAEAALAEHQFAALILDMRMPDLDGPAALARLRRVDAELPAVVYSGWATEQASAALAPFEHVDFVPKPARTEDLVSAIERVIRSANRVRIPA